MLHVWPLLSQRRGEQRFGGAGKIGVVEDDRGGLAAELQGDRAQQLATATRDQRARLRLSR
jgi:hypothetical protein